MRTKNKNLLIVAILFLTLFSVVFSIVYGTVKPDGVFINGDAEKPTVDSARWVVGDFTGDGDVSDDDALYLLYHTFFPTDYPIAVPTVWDGSQDPTTVVNTTSKSFSGVITGGRAILYVPYNFYKNNSYTISIKCSLGTENVNNCLQVQTAKTKSIANAYIRDNIHSSDLAVKRPLCGVVKDFSTGDNISDKFTATEDAVWLAVVYYGVPDSNYRITVEIGRIASLEQVDDAVYGRGVVALNKDVEPYILQFGRQISKQTLNNEYERLNFLYFSDIHCRTTLWSRICDYMDEYSDIIPFAIHGGDFTNDLSKTSFVDLYNVRKPANGAILNTVGNHDCYPAGETSPTASAETVYKALYKSVDPKKDGWDCVFGTEAYAMYWYKDIPKAGVRIICLDQYHWSKAEAAFFKNALTDAKTKDYAVITVTHTPITTAVDDIGSGFWTLDDWRVNDTYQGPMIEIRAAINSFISQGGIHIVHLCGHIHSDQIGTLTDDGIFQIRTQMAADNTTWTDTVRKAGTKTYDCFNVIQIDRNLNMIKLVRIGCNTSDTLQPRTTLCYDYLNKKLISNN